MKTISDHPLLIGEILRRAQERQERGSWWKRMVGLERRPKTHVVAISATETIYSPNR
jgi:hypothetical protein